MITKAVRATLLEKARYRCCLHRLAWLDVAVDDPSAARWRPLELHHVVFQSCGGSDEPANLVPLCPSCHTLIHRSHMIGRTLVDDLQLRALWELWTHLTDTVLSSHHVGIGQPVATVTLSLNVYGLDIQVSVDDAVSFADARRSLLDATIGVLATNDPHFPFPRGRTEPSAWKTSFDDVARPWNRHTAADVFTKAPGPLRLTAPVIFTLDSRSRPELYGTDEQRTI